MVGPLSSFLFFFFFNDTATTEIYTLSLHDALPIWCGPCACEGPAHWGGRGRARRKPLDSVTTRRCRQNRGAFLDRKSTRLNSSHLGISYAVFCLKKKTIVPFGFARTSRSLSEIFQK